MLTLRLVELVYSAEDLYGVITPALLNPRGDEGLHLRRRRHDSLVLRPDASRSPGEDEVVRIYGSPSVRLRVRHACFSPSVSSATVYKL